MRKSQNKFRFPAGVTGWSRKRERKTIKLKLKTSFFKLDFKSELEKLISARNKILNLVVTTKKINSNRKD